MAKKPNLNLDAITAAINGNYDGKANGEKNNYSPQIPEVEAIVPTAVKDAPVSPEPQERQVTAPFIIIDLQISEEDSSIVDSFVIHAEGIEGTAEAIVNHLQKVIDTIREQNPSIESGTVVED